MASAAICRWNWCSALQGFEQAGLLPRDPHKAGQDSVRFTLHMHTCCLLSRRHCSSHREAKDTRVALVPQLIPRQVQQPLIGQRGASKE